MHGSVQLEGRRRARAAFVVLAKESELWPLVETIKQLEDRFNHWANYDWIFLNDGEFSDQFKRYTQAVASSKCHYGQIEPSHWHQPDW
jgi:alpha 1,2-mannosyltransferase